MPTELDGFYIFAGVIGLSIIAGAVCRALYIERRHRKRHPDRPVPVRATDGTFTISFNGETSLPIAWDATAEAINVVLQYPARKRGIAEASGADTELDFYTDPRIVIDDGPPLAYGVDWFAPNPDEHPWALLRDDGVGEWHYREYFAEPYGHPIYGLDSWPPKRYAWADKSGRIYVEDEAPVDRPDPVQAALKRLQEIWLDSAWDWTFVIGDAEDHIIRSEN